LALIAHTSQKIFDPLHGKGRGFGAAVLPTVDGGEGDAELGRKFFLGKTRSIPKLTD